MSTPKFEDTLPLEEAAPQESGAMDIPRFEDSVDLPSYANGASPLTPINKSPIGPLDAAALSLGNEAGNIKYLKGKFEDAVKSDGDLLVKDQGFWHRVDPSNLGEPDAWTATRKIIGTLQSMSHPALAAMNKGKTLDSSNLKAAATEVAGLTGIGLDIAGSIGGTALGSLTGGPVGGIVGSGAGGATGEALRTSLGRLSGTYEATPEQQLKDIAWEGLLSTGGETIALGVKPTLPMLKTALKNTGEWATNFGKEVLSSVWGDLTPAGKWATRRAMDNADSVIGKTDTAIKAIGIDAPREETKAFASKQQSNIVTSLANESKAALQGNYRQTQAEILKEVPSNFTANIKEGVKSVQQQLVDSGYGFFEKNGDLRIFTPSQVAERLGTTPDKLSSIVGEKTEAALNQIAKLTNQYSKYSTLKGVSGAKQLMDMRKALGESFGDLFAHDVPDSIQRIAGGVKDNMNDMVSQFFVNSNEKLGQKYIQMNAAYSAKKDAVDLLNDAVKKGKIDSVVQHLVSKAGKYNTLKDEAKSVAELLGQKGHQMINDVLDWEASKGFGDYLPKMKGGSSLDSGIQKVVSVASAGTQTNARVVGKQIQYGSHFLGFVKSLPPKQLKEFLGNDEALKAAITPIMQAYDGEDHTVRELLTQTGVIPNGQQ